MNSHWTGKKVAFLGDSITDKIHVGTAKNYWQYLEEWMGITPLVYGLNGWRWNGVPEQAANLKSEHGTDVDAIIVFMGTNDFNGGVPLGEWWNIRREEVLSHGKHLSKPRRYYNCDPETFRGRINIGMKQLKTDFPQQQIILLTPIHRGFACFGGTNIQPEDSFPNDIGHYLEEYVDDLKEAGRIWSVPVIDLYSLSGLLPANDSYAHFFHDEKTDRLHPNAAGHERIARTLMYQLLALPSDFR